MAGKTHLLFICTANVCRSPLAASLFQDSEKYEARSAGTYADASFNANATQITQDLIDWAEKIFVMEEAHLSYLKDHFELADKEIEILDVENTYQTWVPEEKVKLTEVLRKKLVEYL